MSLILSKQCSACVLAGSVLFVSIMTDSRKCILNQSRQIQENIYCMKSS